MSNRLENKVAIVIGAGSCGPGYGNGKAAAVLFAREGAKVFAVDINQAAVDETKAIIDKEGNSCTAHQADVSKSDQVKAMVDRCIDAYGRIDVLYNNVGIAEFGGPVEASEESWDRVNEVNIKSFFLTCKYVLPHMEKQGSGSIINMSSTAAMTAGDADYVSYNSTKAAAVGFTISVAIQYARKGIRVNCIHPGVIYTPMLAGALQSIAGDDFDSYMEKIKGMCPMGKLGDAWDTAHAALFLASDEAKYITGAQLVVDGGLTRVTTLKF